ncbi:lanthionine synthetase LanC family protein [Peristeroidobacter agariperforans]|uniref:lanthionine synthetase LanC family protein n=1 Tax=Peristeroidobacter agariperforans TaxID=268404 RepID=UPI00101C211C|nr:lanthionine synthetase LanC family protein [Peristeroidobacter agariperforans]
MTETIVNEHLRAGARDALLDIVRALPLPGQTKSPALAGGEAGLAIFHAYLAKSGLLPPETSQRHLELTFEHLQSAVAALPAPASRLDLYSSFVGVAWAANHAHAMEVLPESDDLCDAADEAVLEGLREHGSSLPCELIFGLSGIGVYGLARWHRPAGRQIVECVVRALEESAVLDRGLRTWFHSPEHLSANGLKEAPEGYFNLGLSHGVPGALVFLSKAAGHGVPGAQALLIEARHWLLLQQRAFSNGSRFGFSVLPAADRQPEIEGSKVAWCYGDLGVCAALLQIARHARRTEWEPVALDLARALAHRPAPDRDVMDAGLCHGALGNAHIFARLHAASGERCLHEAALRWLQAGLAMRKEGAPAAGFLTWFPPQPDEPTRDPWIPRYGLLEGIGGIGLALLGFLTQVPPAWDEFMMVDIPAAGG